MKPKTLQEFFQDESRWMKGELGTTDDDAILSGECCCLMGAIYYIYNDGYVCPNTKKDTDTFAIITCKVADAISKRVGRKNSPTMTIALYNDAPDTTIEDIREIVKEANV